ncbi:MAG: DUF4224 domain-containing protein [Sterolibacteriaceae bacterium]|uniref:DUF4224 domain-containing protein n=1 Tax=Candidatus Methylophosphatis roskildensis TaxID=2899263 RepID=A0A9D7E6A7_9PROT|nr:DUF4224 domain-containing protein [Candidatus Methylophosphatis roskildensis]MBK7238084.1 DUF4224 domain-containing protein [Sterolibacteriaceae bacterium]
MFLTDDELRSLTKRSHRDAQARVLTFMGIEHKVRPDGSLAVLSAHVERMFGGPPASIRGPKKAEPNWDAVR